MSRQSNMRKAVLSFDCDLLPSFSFTHSVSVHSSGLVEAAPHSTREYISRRRLAGQHLLAYVLVFHLETSNCNLTLHC